MSADVAPYRHVIRVRYGECDQQGVVFNANYLAYVDDCVEGWLIEVLADAYLRDFDVMLKRATVEWDGPARHRDELVLVPHVSRWGTTSFDVTVEGAVGDRHVFTATIVYVSVRPGSHEPVAVPDAIRGSLSAPPAPPTTTPSSTTTS